jgi:hypothetical protein
MTAQSVTDSQIRAAFVARSAGSTSPELAERIHAGVRSTRQQSRLVVLPGGLGVQPQRLLWAAAIAATSLAMIGGLLLAGNRPDDETAVPQVVTPTPSPIVTPEPTQVPSESPALPASPEPTPSVDPTPVPADPGFAVDKPVVTLVDDLRVRSLPTVNDASAKLEPLLPAGRRLLVIEESVTADGYVWYHVVPFASEYPSGWVAAGSREGEPWIAADEMACPATSIDSVSVLSLGVYGGLAC